MTLPPRPRRVSALDPPFGMTVGEWNEYVMGEVAAEEARHEVDLYPEP